MKRLLDDTMTTRPLASLFYTLGASRQIQGHHLSRDRAIKVVDRIFYFFLTWCAGLLVGWAIWGRG